MLKVANVKKIAEESGWELKSEQKTPPVLIFKRLHGDPPRRQQVNVYWTTGTVSTALWHPSKGRSQLHRTGVDLPTLRKIFENPRVHTGAGYYTKQKRDLSNKLV